MSIRRGYYYFDGQTFDGPFSTTTEAKQQALVDPNVKPSQLTIRAIVALEGYDASKGEWRTLH